MIRGLNVGTRQENKVNSEKLQDGQFRAKLDELWETAQSRTCND